jgi:hypothetical protein
VKPPEIIAVVAIILGIAFVTAIVIFSRNPKMKNPGYNFMTNRWSDDPPLKRRPPKPPKRPDAPF